MGDVSIYSELGRFMLGPYGCLVSTVLHEKKIHKNYIGLDSCAANLMRPAMYGSYHHITVMGKENEPHDHKYDVTGGLCENNDKFAIDRMLPKIDIGDLIVMLTRCPGCNGLQLQRKASFRRGFIKIRQDNQLIHTCGNTRRLLCNVEFLRKMSYHLIESII